VRLTFLGVRGSTPAPGPEFVRYGGHTSCVAIARGSELPTLALDAGTGLRGLTGLLDGKSFEGSLLISHLHWDHVQGVPFFAAGDRDNSRVDMYLPAQEGRSGRDLLAQLLSPPAFPITPEGLRGAWTFNAMAPGDFAADGFEVTACEVEHKGGRTYAYRVTLDGSSVAYAPDHAPAAGVSQATLQTLAGVDVLIHDAQFLEPERFIANDYGHATVDDAVALAERVGAGTLVLFHHGPNRTDDALDSITDGLTTDLPVVVAREGLVLDV
jgi:phosphoribosyl 1,2-cyclic phosphodiesterase